MIEGYKTKTVHYRWEIIAFLARKNIVDEDYIEDDADEIRDIMKSGADVCYGQLCPYHSEINESRRLIVSDNKDRLHEMVCDAAEEI
ncbi:hypothetical protein phiAS5_ORF0301 [Aeromonas phage phiAS5]|uniref:Uncharacterized protein n=1 Tax=Aeromonas phage phiAS5 TaxID=879630 RepID=E1A255_9CAUD|nr:hypothetical protein phiAS5_ORF0301 [Aeromonas phage phiAS5]ADM80144.1 hypothetical protein phiAS5_ORF0301 [Aeromonas phage phiAS5]